VFPNVGNGQGVHAQPQSNISNAPFGHVPFAPGPAPRANPDLFAYGIPVPTRDQAAAGNLRRLASRILRHPDTHIDMISMEPNAAGHCDIIIILKAVDVLAVTVPEDHDKGYLDGSTSGTYVYMLSLARFLNVL